MAKKSFMKGAVILGIAGIIIKMLGGVFRIPLANIIGDTGMGYYQTAYPIYVLLLSLTTAGFPTAVSRMVSERTAEGNHREAYRVFRISFLMIAVIGAITCVFLLLAAPKIASRSSSESVYAIRAIAPALLVVPLMSAFRGYFQGLQDMMPTAVSQVVEQLFRVAFGLILSVVLVSFGLEYAAAGASFGATAGGLFGLLAIFFIYLRRRGVIREDCRNTPESMPSEDTGAILKRILIIAVPITIGAAIMPVMSNIDLFLVARRLTAAAFTGAEANSLYGQLSGFAAPLINLPQVLTQGIALSLVPAVAAAYQVGDTQFLHKNIQLGLRTSVLIGLPCTTGLLVMAKPIMLLLYPAKPESAASAAGSLAVLAAGVVFLSAVQALTGMLQGIGRQMIPVRNLAIGAVCKVILTYTLTGIPQLNVRGAAFGTICAYLVAAVLNYFAIKKYANVRFDVMLTFLRPLAAAVLMGAAAGIIYKGVSLATGNALATVAAVGAAVLLYVYLVFFLRAITMEELKELPRGGKLVSILEKLPFIG